MKLGFFKKKDSTSAKELEKYHGKVISYAVERKNGEEINLGKKGGISVLLDEIVVLCDGHEVFRCKKSGAVVCGLMSGNGCDIKGVDSVSGEKRHVICFYAQIPN